ncbi:MAG TPA: hypothetical protein VLT58_00595 [Polyangia bacterium]|nr:hypothetical protein [Polyangia bacterium]
MKIALLLQVILWAATGDGTPSCPTRDAVAQAVAQAIPPALHAGAPMSGELPASVQITDLGDGFEVTVGREVQRYADPARDCTERARVAAVFVALVLSPPAAPAPRPTAPIAIAPLPPPVPAPPAPDAFRAGVAARFDAAAGGGQAATGGAAIGGEARLSVGRHALGIQATAAVLTATESVLKDVRVREQRFPCSLAATLRRRAGQHVELAGAAGVSLTPFTLRGQGLMSPSRRYRRRFRPQRRPTQSAPASRSGSTPRPAAGRRPPTAPRSAARRACPSGVTRWASRRRPPS